MLTSLSFGVGSRNMQVFVGFLSRYYISKVCETVHSKSVLGEDCIPEPAGQTLAFDHHARPTIDV